MGNPQPRLFERTTRSRDYSKYPKTLINVMEKWARVPGFLFEKEIRYSPNLWETIRSWDKESNDNNVWVHMMFHLSPLMMVYLK